MRYYRRGMFSIGPILLEVFFVLLKPQEVVESLQLFRPLYTLPLLIALGFAFDTARFGVALRDMAAAPYLRLALGLYAWALVTVSIFAPPTLTDEAISFGTSLLVCLAIAHSAQTVKLYEILAAGLLSIMLFLAFVGVHQPLSPTRCYWLDPLNRTHQHYDGHPCTEPDECIRDEDDDRKYVCEHPGLMDTSSVGGRVRFRGNVEDPNELALTVGAGLPFAFGFLQRKRTFFRYLLVAFAVVLVGACVFYSKSRGGQLVLGAALSVYFVRRFGWKKGLIVGAIAAAPIAAFAALGGRSAEEAEESALERTEVLEVGIELVKSSPLLGVGKGQFTEHHFLTAHNSYLLAAAELGLGGFAVWTSIMYLAVKTPVTALRALASVRTKEAEAASAWATASLASMAGALIGSFFLSFSFHVILWMHVGMSGALSGIVRRILPNWRVRLTLKELGAIVAFDLALLLAIMLYTRIKLR